MEEHLVNPFFNGCLRNPPLFSSGLSSFIGAVLIGMVYGAPGGLLLGLLEVVTLTCLERSNSLSHPFPQSTLISPIAGALHNSIVILSSAVGIIAGLVSYSEVIKMKGEGAAGKALALAGPVCLMVVAVTGATLGAILFRDTWIWYIVCVVWLVGILIGTCSFELLQRFRLIERFSLCQYCVVILLWTVLAQCVLLVVSWVYVFVNSQTATVIILSLLYRSVKVSIQANLPSEIVSVSIMCFITETLLAVINPVTAFDTAASTVTAVAGFIPAFSSQLLMIFIGLLSFESWQTDDVHKICFAAAASGSAALSAIEAAVPVLGVAPSIGALMGVAGAVGVSLAAAGAAIDQDNWGGRLGVAVGAAVGGFAASCAHSGLSGMFIGLCAALISFVHDYESIPVCLDLYNYVRNNTCSQVLLSLAVIFYFFVRIYVGLVRLSNIENL